MGLVLQFRGPSFQGSGFSKDEMAHPSLQEIGGTGSMSNSYLPAAPLTSPLPPETLSPNTHCIKGSKDTLSPSREGL